MVTLTGTAVQSRYKDYCQISNSNSGIDATKRPIEDGEGTASKLELSTTAVNVISGFELNDVAAQTGALLKHEVGGLEFDANAIADGGVIVGTASGTMAIRASFLTAGAAGFVKHELGGLEIDISGITTDEFLVGQSAGVIARRTATQSRTHLGLVIGTDVLAPNGDGTSLTGIQADLAVPSQAEAEAGTATTERVWTAQRVGQAVAALETSAAQATQAALEAETNENTYAPPDLIKHSPGVAKVWVKFDLAGTVNASHNVDSVTDTGTGDWTVNITTDFSSADYSVVVGLFRDDSNGTGVANFTRIAAQAAGTFQVTNKAEGATGTDPAAADDMHAMAFGDQA